MRTFIRPFLMFAVVLGAAANANAEPILESIAPTSQNFTFGTDFSVMTGTGFDDVTASLWAVDLVIPSPGGTTSGCEAADFAGFVAGDIALLQRGTCAFSTKVANAEAAGAVGVIVFNEGNTLDREALYFGTLDPFFASVPVFATSFDVGNLLRNGVANGATGSTARMSVTEADIAVVPEPGTITLLGLGLVGFARSRRIGRARQRQHHAE